MSVAQLIEELYAEYLVKLKSLTIDTSVDRAELDKIAVAPTVRPLPGDGVGMSRRETDASLRARIKSELEKKTS